MEAIENLLTHADALYYPPPRHGTLKVAVVAHPEFDHYLTMANSMSVRRGTGIAHDAELRISLSLIEYIMKNAETFDPRDWPYVKAIRAKGEMSLAHHFMQLLKRPDSDIRGIYAGLQRRYEPCQTVEVVDDATPEYVLKAMAESRPICLRGALRSSLVELGADEFVERFGSVALRQNAIVGKQESVADVARKIRDESVDRVYLNGVDVPPELESYVRFPLFDENAFSFGLLWWGKKKSDGVITKLHRDFQISFLAQIWGEKRLHLYSPDQSEELYAAPAFNKYQLCQVDPGAPDLVRYPRYADARPLEICIGPGDILVIPTGWFHCVWALTDVLSVNRFMEERTMVDLCASHAAAVSQ